MVTMPFLTTNTSWPSGVLGASPTFNGLTFLSGIYPAGCFLGHGYSRKYEFRKRI